MVYLFKFLFPSYLISFFHFQAQDDLKHVPRSSTWLDQTDDTLDQDPNDMPDYDPNTVEPQKLVHSGHQLQKGINISSNNCYIPRSFLCTIIWLLSSKLFHFLETFKVGDVVILSNSEIKVRRSFEDTKYIPGTRYYLVWNDEMRSMLGKKWDVLEVFNNGIIGLPSPDGSQEGKWYFPDRVVVKISCVLFCVYTIFCSIKQSNHCISTNKRF